MRRTSALPESIVSNAKHARTKNARGGALPVSLSNENRRADSSEKRDRIRVSRRPNRPSRRRAYEPAGRERRLVHVTIPSVGRRTARRDSESGRATARRSERRPQRARSALLLFPPRRLPRSVPWPRQLGLRAPENGGSPVCAPRDGAIRYARSSQGPPSAEMALPANDGALRCWRS